MKAKWRLELTEIEGSNLLFIAALHSSNLQEQRDIFGSGREATENFKAWRRAVEKLRKSRPKV